MKIVKRVFALILICLSINPVGCNTQDEDKEDKVYKTFIADTPTDEIGALLSAEDTTLHRTKFERNAAKTRDIEFLGNSYTGSYKYSDVEDLNSFVTDIYVTSDRIRFGLKKDSGDLIYLNTMNKNFFETEPYLPDVENASQYAEEYAYSIASGFIDISRYEIIPKEPDTKIYEQDGKKYTLTYYGYDFVKKVGNFYSSDRVWVCVTSKGHLAALRVGDVGVFQGKEDIADDIDKINESINDKINNIYTNLNYEVKNVEMEDQRIACTSEGKYMILSEIRIQLSGMWSDTGIRLITYLN